MGAPMTCLDVEAMVRRAFPDDGTPLAVLAARLIDDAGARRNDRISAIGVAHRLRIVGSVPDGDARWLRAIYAHRRSQLAGQARRYRS
jgi:hypothetical protein